jgi:hypothetical protein
MTPLNQIKKHFNISKQVLISLALYRDYGIDVDDIDEALTVAWWLIEWEMENT